jgi:hypothetical protein
MMNPGTMYTLNRLRRAITWGRSHDYLNPGFGQRNRPEWMDFRAPIMAVVSAR